MPKNSFQTSYLYLLGYRDNLSLGKCFHYRHRVKKDLSLAKSYYLEAAQQNPIEAFDQLHILSSEEGYSSEADYYLGRKHDCLALWQDALTVYKRAGEAGYVFAFYRAGLLFKQDRLSPSSLQTIKKDLTAELAWYRKAATAYSKHALDALMTLSTKESKAALHLAQMYENGEIGNKKILSTAVNYYEKASEMGNPIAAYRLGQLYEIGEKTFKSDQRKAFAHYLIAAKKQDKKALEGLERIIKKLNDANLQLQLADVYENSFRKTELALKAFKELADKGNKIALERMNRLANRYVSCAYELGSAYELNHHYRKAFSYYLIAAKKRDKKSLKGLESVISKLDDLALQFQLADVYEKSFNKKELALKYFKILADQGNTAALARMILLAKSDANFAYELAKSYASDSSNKEKSYQYYIFAMQNNHNSACNELTSLAESGDTEAQYALGQLYYHPQQRFTEAIHWCLLAAEQQHSKATDYINNTVFPSQYYLMLARCYEDGVKGASENKELSLFFYKKAIVEQDKEAAFHLGQIYQFELEDEKTAFDYFLQAVKWGHSEAIIFLEQLGAEIDPGRQLKLANLYRDPPFNDQRKAFIWEQKAADGSRLQGSPLKEGLIDNLSKSKKMDIDLKKISLLGQQSKQQDIYFKR